MTYMIGHPGKKLLFMGTEFGQFVEWREYEQLQWQVIDQYPAHKETLDFFKSLNKFYRSQPALWESDYDTSGFSWIDANNSDQSILSFIRHSKDHKETLVFICNFTPMVYHDYHIGVPKAGAYTEVFNSDDSTFGGSGQIISEDIFSTPESSHGQAQRITIKIPPMGATIFKFIN